jgi:hypothetical protein
LHNFCIIDERLLLQEGIHFNVEQSPPGEQADEELADHLDSNHVNTVLGGGASLVEPFSPAHQKLCSMVESISMM